MMRASLLGATAIRGRQIIRRGAINYASYVADAAWVPGENVDGYITATFDNPPPAGTEYRGSKGSTPERFFPGGGGTTGTVWTALGGPETPGELKYVQVFVADSGTGEQLAASVVKQYRMAGVSAFNSDETTIEGVPKTITPDAYGDSLTTTIDSVTGPGTATVNADGFRIDVDPDPNSDGSTIAVAYTVSDGTNTDSATASVLLTDWDLEATLTPALVQITDAQTIADAWADASMPTAANFGGLTGDVTTTAEGQIDGGAWSVANMTADLVTDQTYAARVIVTDTYGNTATFTTGTHTVASSTATVPSAFVAADWTIVDNPDVDGNKADITTTTLPADGGSPLTAIRYTVDAGTQQTLTNSPTAGATYTVTLPLVETQQAIVLYAINSVGTSAASDTKNVTPTYSFIFTEESGTLTAAGTEGEYTFEVTDTESPYYANSPYTYNTANLATGPIALDIPPIEGGTADGSILDGEPALFVADEDDGAYSVAFQWQRSPAGTNTWADISNQTARTYTVDTVVDEGNDLRRVERATSADTGTTEAASNVIAIPAASGDVTPPVLTNAFAVVNDDTSASLYVTTDESGGTMYRMATTDATQPTEAQMLDGSAPTAVMHASSGVPTIGEQTRTYNGFTATETYYGWWMQVDAAGNPSNIIGTGSFTMAANAWDATFSTDGSATVVINGTPAIPTQPTGTFSSDGTVTVEITG